MHVRRAGPCPALTLSWTSLGRRQEESKKERDGGGELDDRVKEGKKRRDGRDR
jgi:hypothetical protein